MAILYVRKALIHFMLYVTTQNGQAFLDKQLNYPPLVFPTKIISRKCMRILEYK